MTGSEFSTVFGVAGVGATWVGLLVISQTGDGEFCWVGVGNGDFCWIGLGITVVLGCCGTVGRAGLEMIGAYDLCRPESTGLISNSCFTMRRRYPRFLSVRRLDPSTLTTC